MKKLLCALVTLCLLGFSTNAFAVAQQLDFFLSAMQDVNGEPISGAIVVTRNSANSAAKAVWEDRDQTLPSPSGKAQFNLDSEGRAEVFGEGVYTVLIYASSDTGLTSPLYTFSGVSYSEGVTEASLADNSVGSGSDLIAHTGTSRTVTETLDGYSDGTVALASPTITSFVNSEHDHLSAAQGGTLPPQVFTYPVSLDGLEISNNQTDPVNDIDIAAGAGADTSRVYWVELASDYSKKIDALWSAGSAAGMLDTGTVAVDTWYAIYLIGKTDGTGDILASTSGTAPNMTLPNAAGYTVARRIGWVYAYDNAATPNIRLFHQLGDYFFWDAPQVDRSQAVFGSVGEETVAASAPSGYLVDFRIWAFMDRSTQSEYIAVYSPDQTAASASASNFVVKLQADNDPDKSTGGIGMSGGGVVKSDSSGDIIIRASGTSPNVQAQLVTIGYYDYRLD